jgi:hypothetical protein
MRDLVWKEPCFVEKPNANGQWMEERELILIGTVHGDPDGMALLLQLLRYENPVHVTVEVSPYGLSFRQRRGRRLLRLLGRRFRRITCSSEFPMKKWGQVQAISAQIGFPFEYRASLRYCRDEGALLSCLDLSSQSRQLIEGGWEELISTKNLGILCQQNPENLEARTARAYALASTLLKEKEAARSFASIRGWQRDVDWQRREAFLAAGLESRWVRMERGKLAHIGGWQHLLCTTESGTLCERLAHLHPRRILLGEYLRRIQSL